MKKRHAIVALVFAGCAIEGTARQECYSAGACDIAVVVVPEGDLQCSIAVDDDVRVKGANGRTITWTLASPGFAFKKIWSKDYSTAGRDFLNPAPSGPRRQFTKLINGAASQTPDGHSYGIQVLSTNQPIRACNINPIIANNN